MFSSTSLNKCSPPLRRPWILCPHRDQFPSPSPPSRLEERTIRLSLRSHVDIISSPPRAKIRRAGASPDRFIAVVASIPGKYRL
jgi:hypothetical protein